MFKTFLQEIPRKEDRQVAAKLQADGQPAIVNKGRIVRSGIGVHAVVGLADETTRCPKGSNGAHARKSFSKVGVYWRASHRLEPLQLTRGGDVEFLVRKKKEKLEVLWTFRR